MMDRRLLVSRALWLLGAAASAGAVTACTRKSEPAAKVESAATGPAPDGHFTAARFAILARLADLLIPQTDTPGALAVGAPEAMTKMVGAWGSAETKASFDALLDEIEARSRAAYGKSFVGLEAQQQFDLYKAFDAEKLSVAGPASGLPWDSPDAGPYGRLKELLMTAYYLSEPGATVELRHEEIPGPFRGDIPFAEVGRAWAAFR